MDPGTALSVVSLTFQVFSGCVKECQYLRVRLKTEQYRLLDWGDVTQLDETDERLLISNSSKGLLLDVLDQKNRLLQQFGRFDDKYKKLSKPLLVDTEETADGLSHAPPAYSPTEEKNNPVQRVDSDFQRRFPQSEVLLKKSLTLAKKSREFPRKLKWAIFDKARLEMLVLKLSSFNDFMREMLNHSQLQSLAIKQARTEFQIMQLNSSIQNLVELFESTALKQVHRSKSRYPTNPVLAFLQSRGLSDDTNEEDSPNTVKPAMQSLAALAQSKALNSAIEDEAVFTDEFTTSIGLPHTATQIRSVELSRSDIHILDADPEKEEVTESHRVEAYYQPPRSRKTSVWIEWKTYEPPTFHSTTPDPKVHSRVKALAALLKENNQTDQFRAPHCLGYFRDVDPQTQEDHCRFGLVFEKPASAHPSTRPISLHTLLTSKDVEMPSLSDRIVLMRLLSETIERLHAVNWLHKGLRSSNILFFSDCGAQEIDYSEMYISGFDYSRPALNDDLTEKPPESASEDIYRHPKVQGNGNRDSSSPLPSTISSSGTTIDSSSATAAASKSSYKKSYDIYSLGIILLEIAYWAPIDSILGIQDLANARPSATIKVRGRLLDDREGVLRKVKSRLGNRMESVVKACLQGTSAFGLSVGADERTEEGGARLQREFYERVVRVLGDMRV